MQITPSPPRRAPPSALAAEGAGEGRRPVPAHGGGWGAEGHRRSSGGRRRSGGGRRPPCLALAGPAAAQLRGPGAAPRGPPRSSMGGRSLAQPSVALAELHGRTEPRRWGDGAVGVWNRRMAHRRGRIGGGRCQRRSSWRRQWKSSRSRCSVLPLPGLVAPPPALARLAAAWIRARSLAVTPAFSISNNSLFKITR